MGVTESRIRKSAKAAKKKGGHQGRPFDSFCSEAYSAAGA
jgi:hypothetical protein